MLLEKLTRELGKAIQQDERYLALQRAIDCNEKDFELNEKMAQVQDIQKAYQNEASKSQPDESVLHSYDEQFRKIYVDIMANANMQAYEKARTDIDNLMTYLTGILAMCVNGEDPDTCQPQEHICGNECCNH